MRIYLIAGEPSGDLLAGRLMAALRQLLEEREERVEFFGIGGEAMVAQGLKSLFPMSDLSVMGFLEVIPRIPKILRRAKETLHDIEQKQPDVLITVDSWGFTGRIVRRVKAQNMDIPCVHYVAPMVWAWKEGRARKMAQCVDHLMTLLPNEPSYFTVHGLPATHVGHAVIEGGADKGDGSAFRKHHGIDPSAPLLCVLPGSRLSETSRLLPVFGHTVVQLKQRYPDLEIVIPTVQTVADSVRADVEQWPIAVHIVEGTSGRYAAFSASTVALAASGTVALELAMANVPMIVAYRVSAVTAFLARRFLKIKYASLVNILADAPIVPELLQEDCKPNALADALDILLSDDIARQKQRAGFRDVLQILAGTKQPPSIQAAQCVLRVIDHKEKR